MSMGFPDLGQKVKPDNKRVFIWKDFREWKLALEGMFKDILTLGLKAKIKKNRAIVEYCDDPETFEKLAGQPIKTMITAKKINEFRQRYSHIRFYHACRPTAEDIQSYYEKGVLPSIELKDVQVDRFRSIFLNGDFPELTEEMLQQSIEKVGPKDKELSLEMDDRFVIEYSGHYLIYGSEYLGNLVHNLPIENIDKYKSVLREIGRPTFIEINLPNTTEYVYDDHIAFVINRMITEWTSCLAYSTTEPSTFELVVELSKPLPPEHIYSHSYPTKITDIPMGNKIYDAETGEYEENNSEG